jgi:hypothetical protein
MFRPQALTHRSLERDGLSSYDQQPHEDSSEVASENLISLSAYGVAHCVHHWQTRRFSQTFKHPILIFRKSIKVISWVPSLTLC